MKLINIIKTKNQDLKTWLNGGDLMASCKLYELAIWYIRKCNSKWDKTIKENRTIKKIRSLDRLTYREGGSKKAYLYYGADAEWKSFSRYNVLDNAIQKLAEYEDKEYDLSKRDIKNEKKTY